MYVPSAEVPAAAAANHGTAFDIPGVQFGHQGALCSFDAFIAHYRLGIDPALNRLADIVRAAGFRRVSTRNFSGGIAALTSGRKI